MLRIMSQILYRSIENKDISYKSLNEDMKNKNIILIDVRSRQEYEEGHLEGSINIPVYDIEKKIERIVKNKKNIIVVYCSSGYRSKKAKEILESLCYENVYNLIDGIEKIWIK